MIIRTENDFWSRPEDLQKLSEHLIYAKRVETVTIPKATHFVHLDRPEKGRDLFLKTVIRFLEN